MPAQNSINLGENNIKCKIMSVFEKLSPCIHAMVFFKTPLVIPVLKLNLNNITFILNHVEISAFRLPRSILTSGYPTTNRNADKYVLCIDTYDTLVTRERFSSEIPQLVFMPCANHNRPLSFYCSLSWYSHLLTSIVPNITE